MTIHISIYLVHWSLSQVLDADNKKFTMEDKREYTDSSLHSVLERIVVKVKYMNILP